MKIASYNTFATDLRSRGFEYALAHTEELGFDGVEALYLNQGLPSIDDVKRAKERFDAYGLEVVCYSVGVNLTPDKALLTEKELTHHANVAAALGSPFLHHTLATALRKTPELPTCEDIFDCVLSSAHRVAEYCATLGITCIYEPQGVYFNGVEGLERFFEEMKRNHDNIGILGDIGNPLFVDDDPIAVFRRFGDDIKHLHAKNYRILQADDPNRKTYHLTNGSYLLDTDLQSGVIDIPACFAELGAYPHAVSIEKDGTDEEIHSYIQYLRNITAE